MEIEFYFNYSVYLCCLRAVMYCSNISKIDTEFCVVFFCSSLLWILKTYGHCYSTKWFQINYGYNCVYSETIECNLRIPSTRSHLFYKRLKTLWIWLRLSCSSWNWNDALVIVAVIIVIVATDNGDKFHFFRIENMKLSSMLKMLRQ